MRVTRREYQEAKNRHRKIQEIRRRHKHLNYFLHARGVCSDYRSMKGIETPSIYRSSVKELNRFYNSVK